MAFPKGFLFGTANADHQVDVFVWVLELNGAI
jgi:hypothetical protein